MTQTSSTATSGTPSGTAAPRLLHAVGTGALEWLGANREQFRARTDATTTRVEVMERFKPIGELAIIGKVLLREGVAGSEQSVLIRELLDFAWEDLLDGGDLLAWVQHQEPLTPIPLELYVPFRELGRRHRDLESTVRLAHGLASWGAVEVVPNRRLGLARVEARAGLRPSVDPDEALRRTWLGSTPEPWTVEYHIAYDITHAVFHRTDWGERPEQLPADIVDYLTLWLPVWLDDWAELGQWDLLGELLVVDACLPEPRLDAELWRRFAAAQLPDGAMPARDDEAPATAGDQVPTSDRATAVRATAPDRAGEAVPDDTAVPDGRAEVETDPAELFDRMYHPTLVAAFASVMATSRAMTALTGTPR